MKSRFFFKFILPIPVINIVITEGTQCSVFRTRSFFRIASSRVVPSVRLVAELFVLRPLYTVYCKQFL